ncbi:TetR/AcrR family transcriptional regulator C-terminal domain-containing protein [Plantibacter sp. Mn2098]|uniref:TetR/AcrR family transcriptional regulator C-terminal domain-containing protein n=1 Tax=Plantibacter sp. Mn2098 TaxID=3395266 RepID=UPI003BBE079A
MIEGQRRQRLDRQQIVAAALELLDEVGLDRLTTRALAQRLGVQQPALYWHFKNRDELLASMAEKMLTEELPAQPEVGSDPSVWLAERARAFRRALLAHRDGARVHAGSTPALAQLPMLEAQISVMMDAGLSAREALQTGMVISRYTIGWVLEEQASILRLPAPDDIQNDAPALSSALQSFDQGDSNANFEYGLAAVIDGLLRASARK